MVREKHSLFKTCIRDCEGTILKLDELIDAWNVSRCGCQVCQSLMPMTEPTEVLPTDDINGNATEKVHPSVTAKQSDSSLQGSALLTEAIAPRLSEESTSTEAARIWISTALCAMGLDRGSIANIAEYTRSRQIDRVKAIRDAYQGGQTSELEVERGVSSHMDQEEQEILDNMRMDELLSNFINMSVHARTEDHTNNEEEDPSCIEADEPMQAEEEGLEDTETDGSDSSSQRSTPKKQRGRPKKNSTTAMQYAAAKREHLESISKRISLQEILSFFAINLFAGKKRCSIENLFQEPGVLNSNMQSVGYFALARMSEKRFRLIAACLGADIDDLNDHFEDCVQANYVHAAELAPDESMLPLKIRWMCHHFFVRGKPHPNGVLFVSMADRNRILLALRIRRRTVGDHDAPILSRNRLLVDKSLWRPAPATTTSKMILELKNRIRPDTNPRIAVDALYGCFDLMEEMCSGGIDGIYKCRSDRPSWLFSVLVQVVELRNGKYPAVGSRSSCTGVLRNGKSFTAFSIVVRLSGNKPTYAHLISTVHKWTEMEVLNVIVNQWEDKDASRHQEQAAVEYEGVLRDYNRIAPFIDQINDSVTNALPLYRSSRWMCRFVLYFLTMVSQNAYRWIQVLMKSDNDLLTEADRKALQRLGKISFSRFIEFVMECLSPLPELPLGLRHEFKSIKDSPHRSQTGKLAFTMRCYFCKPWEKLECIRNNTATSLRRGRPTRTYCTGCQAPICLRCREDAHTNRDLMEGRIAIQQQVRQFLPLDDSVWIRVSALFPH